MMIMNFNAEAAKQVVNEGRQARAEAPACFLFQAAQENFSYRLADHGMRL